MPRQAFRHMVGSLAGYFDRGEGARSDIFARGPQPNSNFYRAHGRFHLFNNCNTWTARVLRAGGVNLSPTGVITAGQLMSSLPRDISLGSAAWYRQMIAERKLTSIRHATGS